jgi:putative flippase GtrA
VPGVLTPEGTTQGRSFEPALAEPCPEDSPSEGRSSAGRSPEDRSLRGRTAALAREHLRPTTLFLLVGGAVFLLDTAMYNLLVFWSPSQGWGAGIMHSTPLLAKLATIAVASCLTYLGNRLWTFGDRPRPDTTRSIALFILINLLAAGLQLSCLGFSRYVLGLDSVLADNISGTLIGQIVSTSFRYVTYGRLVFPKR